MIMMIIYGAMKPYVTGNIPSLYSRALGNAKFTKRFTFYKCSYSFPNRPNRLRFVLPISSHVTMPMGSFGIMLLFAFMAQLCMA